MQQYIPIYNWFYSSEDDFEYDVITFKFELDQGSLYSLNMDILDPLFGLVNVRMGQSVQIEQIFYQSKTVAEILATAGGQIVAIIGISQFFLINYQ